MLIFIIVLVVVASIFEYFSLRDPSDMISYSTSAGKSLLEPGEEFDIVSIFQNSSYFPLPHIKVSENLPAEIIVDTKKIHTSMMRVDLNRNGSPSLLIRSDIYLMPKQLLQRRIPAKIKDRGRYIMRGAVIRNGDFFGLRETALKFESFSEIIVMPERAQDLPEITALGNFLGNISVRRFIMEDPVLTLGFHEYTGTEPQRDISWLQSARVNKMMVKKYDYTLEPSVTILLNIDCGEEERDTGLVEKCFCIARSVCELMEQKRIQYGFLTNAIASGAKGGWPVIGDGLGQNHLSAILEGLGRACYLNRESFSGMIDLAIAGAENGRSHVIITPYNSDELNAAVSRLRRLTGGEAVAITAQHLVNVSS